MTDEEKKAIKKLRNFCQYNWEMNKLKEKEFAKPYFEALDTILNLIEKQSKEIEELKKGLEKRIKYCNELEKDLFENCSNYVVSKAKIKAKIEEFKQVRDEILREEKEFNRPMMTYDLKRNDYCEKMLQSLLEKEE